VPDPEVTIRRSRRVRHARIAVAPFHGVELVVPARTTDRQIRRLLERNREWIAERAARASAAEHAGLGLQRTGVAWVHGEALPTKLSAEPLERWYRREARCRISDAVHAHGRRLGLDGWRRITIRDQRTRWGSCSATGTLSFSWRLVVAPLAVLDYVVVHELCHLRQLDHSPQFWRLLETGLPGWRDGRDWLRRHGHELAAYRP
jgi:predicted metal-dependent hydrolase